MPTQHRSQRRAAALVGNMQRFNTGQYVEQLYRDVQIAGVARRGVGDFIGLRLGDGN